MAVELVTNSTNFPNLLGGLSFECLPPFTCQIELLRSHISDSLQTTRHASEV